METDDYLLALELQREFDREFNQEDEEIKGIDIVERNINRRAAVKRKVSNDDDDLNSTKNLVHPEWETLDPIPDIHAMFSTFDNKFFQNRLKCVSLEWSKRMYSCAGICYSRRCRLGMSVTIRLSEPLLKLRSRKDLVETLLHEMIHAYCFVLGIREGNGGHGPNFKKIMYGINQVAGTNITVYHTFYDEVDLYKIHWWRCNGICQHRKPFYGYVKRSSNRQPGPNDTWWLQHKNSCGGYFLKIKGPDLDKQKEKKRDLIPKGCTKNDLRNYFVTNSQNPVSTIATQKKSHLNNETQPAIKPSQLSKTPKYPVNKNLGNVVELKDISNRNHINLNPHGNTIFSGSNKNITHEQKSMGKGYSLNQTGNSTLNNSNDVVDLTKIRDVWTKKFNKSNETIVLNEFPNDSDVHDVPNNNKKRRISMSTEWTELDDELIVLSENPEVICLSSDDESSNCSVPTKNSKVPLTTEQRRNVIKQEIIDCTDYLEDEIDLIDDDYDDSITLTELADTSLIDDLFGEDTLLKDFRVQNSVVASSSQYFNDPKNDIVSCPICQEKTARKNFEEHLNGCCGTTVKVDFKKNVNEKSEKVQKVKDYKKVLKKAGYTEEEISIFLNDEFLPIARMSSKSPELKTEFVPLTQNCPVCRAKVAVDEMSHHLDNCLKNHT